MDSLKDQLADLQLHNKELQSHNHVKKVAPAVPPKKKKAQPQVPQSCTVKSMCEPLYSTRLQGAMGGGTQYYSNVLPKPSLYKREFVDSESIGSADCSQYSAGPGSTGRVYSNVPRYSDPLPPPPPPDMNPKPIKTFVDCHHNVEELLPPSSPVSSNYSELVRATNPGYNPSVYRPDYGYGSSRMSSAYESLYEPIEPQPHSQMSAHTNSSYAGYQGAQNNLRVSGREAEVDNLTDLLVQSMGDSRDPDVYGICVNCGDKVIGETAGCTAMDQIYHISCFSCCQCTINLQGKPFYAIDGKPYCEEDYLNSLEKCSVCTKPILERILRATGKPYHPSCFTCVVCGKSLDGVPFTVDATNQIHCIEDFHRKFAPRCCVCLLPIMPELGQDETVRVVALDRSFHVGCYRCEDCGLVLSSEAEGRGCYPLDSHILCKSCNARRVQALTNVMTTEL